MIQFSYARGVALSMLFWAGFAHAGADNCDPADLQAVEKRVFDTSGNLRPALLAGDIVRISGCYGYGTQSPLPKLEARLAKDYSVDVLEVSSTDLKKGGAFSGAAEYCQAGVQCRVEFWVRNDQPLPISEYTFAKSGGLPFARFLGHAGKAGHYELTGRGLQRLAQQGRQTISVVAVNIMQDASRDPDFFEWSVPAAHAQTSNDDRTGKLSRPQPAAKQAFVNWTSGYLSKVVAACAQNQPRQALYLLGYSLHGPQDLVFHEGISNAEHSNRDFSQNLPVDDGPFYAEKMAMAEAETAEILGAFVGRLVVETPNGSGCWESMRTWSGAGALADREKKSVLKKNERDFGVLAYFEYKGLADIVDEAMQNAPAGTVDVTLYFLQDRWLNNRDPVRLRAFNQQILTAVQFSP